ncbi:hypothetical protein M413DRAFT_16437 [Hebeloma cylindrosporum]|uniref:Uncharacterized protein n=1 Tax=Hebeloma cylindrosporum TaxID=76867 RepID=A0A0C3CDA9_HEBCY|nr:hypothetical protein M413DRAFT_16437 [Hebeloma cylindrosporum h7]
MASDSPPGLYHHHSKNTHGVKDKDQHHPPRLPVIPDLRFEYSYLRSILPYVSVERIGNALDARSEVKVELIEEDGYIALGEEGNEKKPLVEDKSMVVNVRSMVASPKEIIHLQWRKIFWVTLRDQVISPFLQGALWALASYYLSPFSARLGSQMGTYVRGLLPSKEGAGITWIRGWSKNLGLSGERTSKLR